MGDAKAKRSQRRSPRGGRAAVVALHRAVRAVSPRIPALAHKRSLFRHPYIVHDVVQYRAAAIALAELESTLWRNYAARRLNWLGEPRETLLVQAMADWRGLFSPDGTPYRSLNRTLMNLPSEVPPELVCQLNQVRLERPFTNALELTALLLVVSNRKAGGALAGLRNRVGIFQRATEADIRDAVARVAACSDRPLLPQRLEDLRFALRFLGDYPRPCGHNPRVFVRSAIRWHRDAAQREALRWTAALGGPDAPTARPVLPLPRIPGITFLSTVGAVVEEGRQMRHCIGSYAGDAVRGACFLFHVEHGDETASIEIDARGDIDQACGPRNVENEAAIWGRRQLTTWAAALRRRTRTQPTRVRVRAGARAKSAASLRQRGRPALDGDAGFRQSLD